MNGTDHGTASARFVPLYATVLERRWGADSTRTFKGRFAPLDVVRA